MTQELVLSGADIVKVGIGPEVFVLQEFKLFILNCAVIECADVAHGLVNSAIADGGCTCPGDVAKGFEVVLI